MDARRNESYDGYSKYREPLENWKMTPTDFETRAREAAETLVFGEHEIELNNSKPMTRDQLLAYWAFQKGAQWSRTETIAEILGMLRTEEALDLTFNYPNPSDWADWLESQLKEGK